MTPRQRMRVCFDIAVGMALVIAGIGILIFCLSWPMRAGAQTTGYMQGGSLSYVTLLAQFTSATPSGCQSISASPTVYAGFYNPTQTSTGTVTITVYDEGASPTCAAADVIDSFQAAAVAAQQVHTWASGTANPPVNWQGFKTQNGLAINLSAQIAAGSLIDFMR